MHSLYEINTIQAPIQFLYIANNYRFHIDLTFDAKSISHPYVLKVAA